ncbi:RmlC-like cupin domain-containing protein [Suillus ampliporus]|nr:RmlC-like cupin domain-containing protein [Suillus ampliporus]
MTEQVFHLIPATKSHPWGKIGSSSLAAHLADGAGIPDFTIDESKPYAEMWMGTHPNAPTRVLSTGQLLSEHLAAHPELIGESVIKRFNLENGQIPFLFKVLSFDKALPVQIHLDKETSEHIHSENTGMYVDSSHKTEMVLAVSNFSALCGFLPAFQVSEYLSAVPEFASLFPSDIVQRFKAVARSSDASEPKAALKELFSSYAKVDSEKASAQLKVLVERYQAGKETDAEKIVKSLVLRLYEMYPDDSGVFCAFILNHIKLKPGHAFSIATGEPHAYITGDIIECMATSDNIIAVAFSPPEERDVQNFLLCVQYNPTPGKTLIQPTMFTRRSTHTNGSLLYNPPIDELAIMRVIVARRGTESHHKLRGPSIVVAIEGEGAVVWAEGAKTLGMKKGQVVFIGAGTEVKFSAFETSFKLYRAFVEAV